MALHARPKRHLDYNPELASLYQCSFIYNEGSRLIPYPSNEGIYIETNGLGLPLTLVNYGYYYTPRGIGVARDCAM